MHQPDSRQLAADFTVADYGEHLVKQLGVSSHINLYLPSRREVCAETDHASHKFTGLLLSFLLFYSGVVNDQKLDELNDVLGGAELSDFLLSSLCRVFRNDSELHLVAAVVQLQTV